MSRQGRWYERDMTRRKPSRARLRPFRLDAASDLCRIYPMFFVDNAVKYGSSRIVVAEADGHAVGFVMWGPALEPAWFDPGVERWAELDELHVHPKYQGRGIGTRLVRSAAREARAAGFAVMYLVTEASNASARRVHVRNPRFEFLHCSERPPEVVRVDRGTESVLDGVRDCDRVVVVFRLEDAQHRPEDFLESQALLSVHREDRRGDEEPAVVRTPGQLLPAREELVALLLADVDVLQDLLLLVCRRHGAHVRLLVDRVADPELLGPLDEFVDHVVVDFLVDNQTRRRGAPLPGRPERAEHDAVHQELEVRVVHRDDRVLAAELESDLDHLLRSAFVHVLAGVDAAREGDRADVRMGHETVADDGAGSRDHVHDAGRKARFVEHLDESRGTEGREAGRLQDERATGNEGGPALPGRDRHREIPGRDQADRSDREAGRQAHLVRQLGRHGLPEHPATLAGRVLVEVNDLLDIAAALRDDLAHFRRHGSREVLFLPSEDTGGLQQQLSAPRRGRLLPALEGFFRMADRLVQLAVRGQGKRRQRLARRRVVRLEALPLRFPPLAADEEAVLLDHRLRRGKQGPARL